MREVPTIPTTFPNDATQRLKKTMPLHSGVPQFLVGCAQSTGQVRDHNEDAILAFSGVTQKDSVYLPIGLFVVADGMGGHLHGEVASSIAVQTTAREIQRRIILNLLDAQPAPSEQEIQEILKAVVQEAHQKILAEAPGGGTTLTLSLMIDRRAYIAHVGDSRAYFIQPDGEARVLTRDHSLVNRMVELGHITEDEAAVHPQRNVLYRALGQGEPFLPDLITIEPPTSTFLLLCSDGMWGLVPLQEIVRIILSAPSPEIASQLLVDTANDAGGTDNISVILAQMPHI